MNQKAGGHKTGPKPKNGHSRAHVHGGRHFKELRAVLTGRVFPWLLGGVFTLFFALLVTAELAPPSVGYRVGDVSRRDIKAPQNLRVVDEVATEAQRQAAREKVKPRYDIDLNLENEVTTRLRNAFDAIQRTLSAQMDQTRSKLLAQRAQRDQGELLDESAVFAEVIQSAAYKEAEQNFVNALGGDVPPRLLEWMREQRFATWIREDMEKLLHVALSREIVSDRQLYNVHAARGIVVRDIRTGNRVSLSPSARPIELRELGSFLNEQRSKLDLKEPVPIQRLLVAQVTRMVRPTLTFNNRATVEAQQKAADEVEPVTEVIKEGEMIVREGERINESQLSKLRSLQRVYRQRNVVDNFVGTALAVFILLWLAWLCAKRYGFDFLKSPQCVNLFVLMLMIHVLLLKVGLLFAYTLHETYRGVGLQSFYLVIPFASAPLLAALLQGRTAAVCMSVMASVAVSLMLPGKVDYALITLAGGIFAAIRWRDYRQRSAILLVAVMIGLLNASLVLCLNLQEGVRMAMARWVEIPLAFMGGIANAIIVSAVMPLLESVFKLTTDMRLLELSDQNHPLLRQMVVRAPGTYHHSLMVGNLAEEAAEAIGANPLLSRVGAYFHDVGKMLKPEYFIENQGRENRHDRLSPSMSALILISHVKEGVELGRTHKLPQEIIDLISQHHGTSLIRYFYEKAKNQKGADEVREEAFCYPGPRPQTREAGILMLADMVEATSRTLADPSPGRLAGLVERIVQSAFADGQLDDCNLTLRDLSRIQKAFLRVLAGVHHHRVAYPGQEGPERKKAAAHGDIDSKPAKAPAARPASPAAAGRGGTGRTPIPS